MNALGKTHQSSGYNMTLGRLLEGLDVAAPHGLQVTDLVQDSRAATPGCVFLACPGRTTHGLMHAATAVARGAVAVLWEPGADLEPPVLPERVAAIAIPHLSRHVGELADRFFRRPSADLRVAGITGTNGKTTTAFLLAQASDFLGRRGWYVGTLGHGHPGKVREAGLTTPDAVTVQRRLADIQQVVEERTHELAASKERALVTLESIADGVVTSDANGTIDYLNPVAERLSGWSEKDLVGRSIADLFKVLDETSGQEVENPALGCLRSGIPVLHHEKSLFMDRRGDTVAINESAAPIRDASGRTTGLVLVRHDVSKARLLSQQMSFQATHDALTHLPNRVRLTEHLQASLEAAGDGGRSLAVMFLDLDRFKIVNDTLGHDAGDQLLREVARRLKACVREGDIVSRLGGDEFVIVMRSVGQRAAVQQMAARLLQAFHDPFCVDASEFFTSASIGIALFPENGTTSEMLLKNADATMYRVKAQGKNNYGFYDERTDHRAGERLSLETEMRHALDRGEMVVHYQPQFSAADGAITGFEALVRWLHPVRGLLAPNDFLPLAEETGFIVDIGDWVMAEACRQNRAWQQAGLPKVTMAVNIAHKQFMRPALVNDVRRVLEKTGLEARFLELELTEGILADNAVDAARRLTELKQVGVKLSIDDFGTGYSSLFYLKNFPLDGVKIDRCFIKDLESDPRDAEISAAIIAMSHSLKLSVLAEGVETTGQLDFLRRKGCDSIQGFLFSPAVKADAAEAFLRESAASRCRVATPTAAFGRPSATATAPVPH